MAAKKAPQSKKPAAKKPAPTKKPVKQAPPPKATKAKAAAPKPAPKKKAAPPPPIVELALKAVGTRVDSVETQALLSSLRLGPIPPSTPASSVTHVTDETVGVEVAGSFYVRHRTYFPPRRDVRWLNFVSSVTFTDAWKGGLPLGLSFSLKESQLEKLGATQVPRGRFLVWQFPLPDTQAKVVLADWRGDKRVTIAVPEEQDFITVFPIATGLRDGRHGAHVEDGFFAAWAALNGLLKPERLSNEGLTTIRERRGTPLQFLESALGGLVWSGDLEPTKVSFFTHYFRGVNVPDEQRWVRDVATVFGKANHFRAPNEPMTPDSWDAFDRIAPRIASRYREWTDGKLKPLR